MNNTGVIIIKGSVKSIIEDRLKNSIRPMTLSNYFSKNEMLVEQTENGFIVYFTHLKARSMKHLHIMANEKNDCTFITIVPELQPIIYKVYMILPCFIWLLFGIAIKSLVPTIILILAQVVIAKTIITMFQNKGVKKQIQLLSEYFQMHEFEIVSEN